MHFGVNVSNDLTFNMLTLFRLSLTLLDLSLALYGLSLTFLSLFSLFFTIFRLLEPPGVLLRCFHIYGG